MSSEAHPVRDLARGSPERFGYEWNAYAEVRPEYEDQFRRWTVHLAAEDWHGRSFLDVGCGMGRNSVWPMRYGAGEGVAVDVDERSLAAARRNLADFPTVRVERCSVYDLPFAERFDIAFSIGVVHHLEDPHAALLRMVAAVKPGGRVLIWVYGIEGNRWLVQVLDPLRKALFRHLPVAWVHHLSLYPAALLWALIRMRFAAERLFRAAFRLFVPASAVDRVRPDAAPDRALLVGRDRRSNDGSGRARGGSARTGERDVVVGDRHPADPVAPRLGLSVVG